MKAVRASVVAVLVSAILSACETSPTAPPTAPLQAALTASLTNTKPSGVIACGQTYDSVTRVIGPKGGYLAVGAHYLVVDSLALRAPVSITAVAPAGHVRWV